MFLQKEKCISSVELFTPIGSNGLTIFVVYVFAKFDWTLNYGFLQHSFLWNDRTHYCKPNTGVYNELTAYFQPMKMSAQGLLTLM